MTNHRVTDLSYGHLGKASYDDDDNQWIFSVDVEKQRLIQQLIPLEEWFPAPVRQLTESEKTPSHVAISQLKWLSKSHPETLPGKRLISQHAKSTSQLPPNVATHTGQLLQIGRAIDVKRMSSFRRPHILVMPYGEVGQILRLIMPRYEMRGWGKRSSVRLSLLSSQSQEYGHWVGVAGPIRQIVTSEDDNGTKPWLAVRQSTATTIFRPMYGELYNANIKGHPEISSTTHLDPNPVATLTIERSKSAAHADVALNPWYDRQFAVVDGLGSWSIWDLEWSHDKYKKESLIRVRTGEMYDQSATDPSSKLLDPGYADGFYRVLWVCDLNTILLCNRHHVSVFQVKGKPIRVPSKDLLAGNSTEWILDIKRSPGNRGHVYLLTTARIFWIEISSVVDENEQSSGITVLLSYRHFRDPNDETLQLSAAPDQNVSVMITSTKSLLVNFYSFWVTVDGIGLPRSSGGTFRLHQSSVLEQKKTIALQSICSLRLKLTPSLKYKSKEPESMFLEHTVGFFQLWGLSKDFALASTFCSVQIPASSEPILVTAPSSRFRHPVRQVESRFAEDSFIFSDREIITDCKDFKTGRYTSLLSTQQRMYNENHQRDTCLRISFRNVFLHAFASTGMVGMNSNSHHQNSTIHETLDLVSRRLQRGKEDGAMPLATFAEISGFDHFADDLEKVSTTLQTFLDSLQNGEIPETPSELVISDLASYPESLYSPMRESLGVVQDVYNDIAGCWMASMPLGVPNLARLARFKIVRHVAVELYLSSLGISLTPNLDERAETQLEEGTLDITSLKEISTTRESSPVYFSSQMTDLAEHEHISLPTPARTPSIYSHATSGSELKEDPAITRLRQYAGSIKAKPDLGKSSLLSHWPSTPGSDPAQYSWEAAQQAATAFENGESGYRNRREEARRRRRTEKFLRQERSRVAEKAASQAVAVPSGSQPVLHPLGYSSQTVEDIPMTQPDKGAFGSRSVKGGKKTPRKPRMAGFR